MIRGVGEVIGQYELKNVLGGGGMATVYRGEHVSGIGMTAAIKKLHPHLALDADLRKRLRVEAQALVRLHHPNVVRILDFVEGPDSAAHVVELVEGRTLRAVMDDYQERPMPLSLALLLFRQVLVAVGHAHDQNCLHRDIKPGNVMVDANNHVKVLDFGIASLVDQERLTQTGMSIGTPVYMAPEAIMDGMDALDERADVYALGVTLWEVLAGKGARPIGQRGWRLEPEMVDALADKGVPEGVIDVIRSMVEPDVDRRLATCGAVLRALSWAMDESAQSGTNSVAGLRAPLPAGPNASRDEAMSGEETVPVTQAFKGTMPFGGPTLDPRDFTADATRRPPPRVAELTRGAPEPPRKEKTGGRRKAPAPPRRDLRRPIAVGVALVLSAGAFVLARSFRPAPHDPAALAILDAIPGTVAFDWGTFPYGPESRMVQLSAFAMERTEVDVTAYSRCVAAGACPDRLAEYVGYTPSGASPMEHVDWMQASTYCEWRYRNTALPESYQARLPTDAEWERAARGAVLPGREFPLGASIPEGLASAGSARAPAVGTTMADVTPEGITDLTASVAEWVYDAGPDGAPEEEVTFGYPSDATLNPAAVPAARVRGTRAVRGGSYLKHPSITKYFKSTGRTWMTGTRSGSGRGFRCVVGPTLGGGS